MKKEHTYVECTRCKWQIEQNLVTDRDWDKDPCSRCNNTRLMINPKEILCNMCGESMCHEITVPSGKWITDSPYGLFETSVVGGYESYHLFDMSRYTFSFCEKCLRQLFMQCKIKPQVHDMCFAENLFGPLVVRSEESWDKDQACYEYRVWLDDGGHHQAYLDGKCNNKKDCPNKALYTLLHNDTEFTENSFCEEHKDNKYGNSTLTKFIPNVLKPFL